MFRLFTPTTANMVNAHAQRSIDHQRPMKVIVMGAGISGILAGIRLPQHIPNLELVIYEKNPEIGGTWFENHYPGVACGKDFNLVVSSFSYSG